MNVYSCCYQGNLGYACRHYGGRWMFIPELGQPDPKVRKGLALDDLLFANSWCMTYERCREQTSAWERLLIGLLSWLYGETRPRTLGGLLFLPNW